MRFALVMVSALVLTASAHAQTQPFYMHHSGVPVAIPGGTTSFFLDGAGPAAPLATAEEITLAPAATNAFPTFTTPPFAADTSLLPIASVRVFFSANQKMRECGTIAASLSKLDAGGVPTVIGATSDPGFTIPQGKSSGTVAADFGQRIEFAVTDTSVLTGQGLALTTSFTNACNASRHVFFSYDGSAAAARVHFQCCFTTSAKCAETKIKAVGTGASCLLGAYAKAKSKGFPPDPEAVAKCSSKLLGTFQKAEDRGGCPTTGDGSTANMAALAFASDVNDQLSPVLFVSNKCQTAKIKAAASAVKCLFNLHAKAARRGELLAPDPSAVAKCKFKFAASFAKAETKPPCETTGDAAAIEAEIDAYVNAVASGLACPCP